MDFDLEAPGLADYFTGEAFTWVNGAPDKQAGLIDLFCSYRDNLISRIPGRNLQPTELLQTIKLSKPGAAISFLGPGRQGRDYKQLVCNFDWRSFYERWDGGSFVEQMKRDFTENFDYVLVDSRTGFTDISGICTVQFPDVLVAVFTPGPQSQKGLVEALECVEANRKEMRPNEPLHVLPLPCRVDRDVAREAFTQKAYTSWFENLVASYFATKVVALGVGWHPEEYFRSVAVEYFSRLIYEDTIESLLHDKDDPAGNTWKYLNLIKVIDSVAAIEVSAQTLGLRERTWILSDVNAQHPK